MQLHAEIQIRVKPYHNCIFLTCQTVSIFRSPQWHPLYFIKVFFKCRKLDKTNKVKYETLAN